MFVKLTHNHLMRPAGMNSLDLSVGKQAFRDQITEKKLDQIASKEIKSPVSWRDEKLRLS